MTQSLKDQLVKLLDAPEKRKYRKYTVKAVNRGPDMSPDSILSWEIQLYPYRNYMNYLGDIIGEVFSIDNTIMVSLDAFDDPYIMLF